MEWPLSLPTPLASGYSVDDAFDVVRPADSLGFSPDLRRAQHNSPKAINASLLLSFNEFAVLDWFISRRLKGGAIWLTMALKFDDAMTEVLTRILKVSSATEGRHWKISLTLEVMTHGNTD